MSDTPRTNAILQELAFIVNQYGHTAALLPGIDKLTELCMKLERENAELKELVEQMREALCMADGLIDTLILDNTLSPSINAERMNIRAAIEAAERKNDDNQKL